MLENMVLITDGSATGMWRNNVIPTYSSDIVYYRELEFTNTLSGSII